MQRERITDDIYVFTSDLYAQVTAGVVLTSEGAIVIDTLVYPEETLQIRRFVEQRLGQPVRYVINTHFHADHTTGTCFFNGVKVIAQRQCRELLNERGRASLEQVRESSPEMRDIRLVLPGIVFEESMRLYLGDKTLHMWSTPGHSQDSIVCLVEEDQVLFAADTLMPVPYFVDGSYDDLLRSLTGLQNQGFEIIVQGHGEVILRGEVEEKIQSDIDYLVKLKDNIDKLPTDNSIDDALRTVSIEACGKSSILLNGAAGQLHRQNVQQLIEQRRRSRELQHQEGG